MVDRISNNNESYPIGNQLNIIVRRKSKDSTPVSNGAKPRICILFVVPTTRKVNDHIVRIVNLNAL